MCSSSRSAIAQHWQARLVRVNEMAAASEDAGERAACKAAAHHYRQLLLVCRCRPRTHAIAGKAQGSVAPSNKLFPPRGTRKIRRHCFVRTSGDCHLVRLCLVAKGAVRILSGYEYQLGDQVDLSFGSDDWYPFKVHQAQPPLFDLRYAG